MGLGLGVGVRLRLRAGVRVRVRVTAGGQLHHVDVRSLAPPLDRALVPAQG